jgi:hypothetical protein
MIKTSVIPKNNDLYLSIPNDYVGKEIEVLLYKKEEVIEAKRSEPVSMSSFRGILTPSEADELKEYVKQSREEWDNPI